MKKFKQLTPEQELKIFNEQLNRQVDRTLKPERRKKHSLPTQKVIMLEVLKMVRSKGISTDGLKYSKNISYSDMNRKWKSDIWTINEMIIVFPSTLNNEYVMPDHVDDFIVPHWSNVDEVINALKEFIDYKYDF